MKEVTVVIQGKISPDAYDFYVKNYKNIPVIISTWADTSINFSKLPPNFRIILSQLPTDSGNQNLNYQLVSTLNGLDLVKTKYVIKMRGDEYWSNLNRIEDVIKLNPDKLHTSSVFFRAWQFAEYHSSDHIISGLTENVKLMFESTKYNFDNKLLNVSKAKHNGVFIKNIETHSPEERLTKSYLNAKHPTRFEKVDGRILMKESFSILNENLLKPYKIKANVYKKEWLDDWVAERNFSISHIDKLFSKTPYINTEK
jgi:hypothetical protein